MSKILNLMFGLAGNPTTKDVTAQNTPDATDNTKKLATTDWAKLGFVISKSAIGYIKFPTWMGGLVIQWGVATTDGTGNAAVSFPLEFPNSALSVSVTPNVTNGAFGTYQSITKTTMLIQTWRANNVQEPTVTANWIAIGH